MPTSRVPVRALSTASSLLFVFGGVMVMVYVYRRATRVWWPRYVRRRARAFGG